MKLWSLVPARRNDPELMDAPGLPEAEVAEAYRVLRRVNRQLGNLRSMARELDRFWAEEDGAGGAVRAVDARRASISILDVGSGSGDVLRALRDRGIGAPGARVSPTTVALDRDPTALALAARDGLPAVRGDALRLPFADRSLDVVTAIKFAHHFAGQPLARLLAELARVARRRVIVLDIRRHWLAYWGFVAWSRMFTTNRLVRHDGPLSVLRSFTPDELAAAATPLRDFTWTIRRHPGFQLALIGQKNS